MAVAVAGMAALWGLQQFGAIPKVIDTLWFALLGSAITVAVGSRWRACARRPRPRRAPRSLLHPSAGR
jgi:hypothetical protein